MPRHVKDLHPCHSVTTWKKTHITTISESGLESLLHGNEDTESETSPEAGMEAFDSLVLLISRN